MLENTKSAVLPSDANVASHTVEILMIMATLLVASLSIYLVFFDTAVSL